MSPTASRRFVPDNSPGSLLGLLALVLVLPPGAVRAEADVFGLGNAQHGLLQVRDPEVVINASTALSAEAPAGATELAVEDSTGFAAGELVLVLQMGGEQPLTEYRAEALDLGDSGPGRWELARLSQVASGVLRLTAPLVSRFPRVSQVVRVPEYTDVRISTTGSLEAPAWNGRSGGVLALLATGTVFNQGAMEADGAGLRGGAAESVTGLFVDCQQLDGPPSSGGGAPKGEGLASARSGVPTHGYGRLANAGGGGNCRDAGGGGGSHVGRGGQGGRTSQEVLARDVGGRGGAALGYARPLERLLLGGGGGAGYDGAAGGAGGGIVFVRAREVQGPRPFGIITANGSGSVASQRGGGGGGGAGGSVHVSVAEKFGCTVLGARGGMGGNSDFSPGGGGGGGQLLIQASGGVPSDCVASVSAGLAGTSPAGSHGAGPSTENAPGYEGRLTVLAPAVAPPSVPAWLSPGSGAEVSRQPTLEGRTAPRATVQVFLDGAALGAPVVADDSGIFVFVPPAELALGNHEARAWAEQFGLRSALSAPLTFTVGGSLALQVGFGCAVASGRGAWALGLVLLGVGLARRRRG